MRPWFRRSRRVPQPPAARRRLYIEQLEDRCLLATSVLGPLQAPLVRADTAAGGTSVTPAASTPTPAAPQTPNQQYVSQLFLDLIGQAPASDQLGNFSGQLDQGKSRLSVVQQIQALPAYDTHQVQLMYQTLVGTAPTTDQLNQDVKYLQGGGHIGTLRVRLLSSPTFFQRAGHGTDAGYVSALSQDVLHQSAGAATQDRLSQELAGGASRLDVLKTLVDSHLQQVRQAEVQGLYQGYLHRAATPAEVSQQLPLIEKGEEEAIVASLVSSDEYFNRTVHANVTTLSLTSSLNPSSFGQSVTFTAVVTPAAGVGAPTGTVTFTDTTTGATLGTGTLDATGTATLSVSTLTGGTHVVTATYGGDPVFSGSGGSVTQTVSPAATGTSVSGSPDPSTSGQSVTFTAVVRPATTGIGTPTGTVTFTDTTSGTALGTGTLDSTGVASVSTSTLSPGTHTITATYAGDGNFATSSGTTSQTVTGTASATTTVAGSPNPSVFGQSVTFTATVTPATTGAATPTGTVTFTDTTTGTTLGSGTLNASGQATVSTSSLTVASHTIAASYGGDTTYAPSSGTTTQMVNQAATGTSVSGSPNPATSGQSVTFTATVTVTSPGSGTLSGSVTFTDTTAGTALGTATLDANGQASVTTTSLTTTGAHTIDATYGGTENLQGSSGTFPETVS